MKYLLKNVALIYFRLLFCHSLYNRQTRLFKYVDIVVIHAVSLYLGSFVGPDVRILSL